jgi:hypothetical protein
MMGLFGSLSRFRGKLLELSTLDRYSKGWERLLEMLYQQSHQVMSES